METEPHLQADREAQRYQKDAAKMMMEEVQKEQECIRAAAVDKEGAIAELLARARRETEVLQEEALRARYRAAAFEAEVGELTDKVQVLQSSACGSEGQKEMVQLVDQLGRSLALLQQGLDLEANLEFGVGSVVVVQRAHWLQVRAVVQATATCAGIAQLVNTPSPQHSAGDVAGRLAEELELLRRALDRAHEDDELASMANILAEERILRSSLQQKVLSQQEAAVAAATQLERTGAIALALEEEVTELMTEKLLLDHNNNSSDVVPDWEKIDHHNPDLIRSHNNKKNKSNTHNRETGNIDTSFGLMMDPAAESGCLSPPYHPASSAPPLTAIHTCHNQSPRHTSCFVAHSLHYESPRTAASASYSTTAFETSPPSCLSPDDGLRDLSPLPSSRRAPPLVEPPQGSAGAGDVQLDAAWPNQERDQENEVAQLLRQVKMLQCQLDDERDNAEQAQRCIAHLEAKQVEGAEASLRWVREVRACTRECRRWRELARESVQQAELAQSQRDEGTRQVATLRQQLAEVTAEQAQLLEHTLRVQQELTAMYAVTDQVGPEHPSQQEEARPQLASANEQRAELEHRHQEMSKGAEALCVRRAHQEAADSGPGCARLSEQHDDNAEFLAPAVECKAHDQSILGQLRAELNDQQTGLESAEKREMDATSQLAACTSELESAVAERKCTEGFLAQVQTQQSESRSPVANLEARVKEADLRRCLNMEGHCAGGAEDGANKIEVAARKVVGSEEQEMQLEQAQANTIGCDNQFVRMEQEAAELRVKLEAVHLEAVERQSHIEQAQLLGEELRGHVRRCEAEAEELRMQLEGARVETAARESRAQQARSKAAVLESKLAHAQRELVEVRALSTHGPRSSTSSTAQLRCWPVRGEKLEHLHKELRQAKAEAVQARAQLARIANGTALEAEDVAEIATPANRQPAAPQLACTLLSPQSLCHEQLTVERNETVADGGMVCEVADSRDLHLDEARREAVELRSELADLRRELMAAANLHQQAKSSTSSPGTVHLDHQWRHSHQQNKDVADAGTQLIDSHPELEETKTQLAVAQALASELEYQLNQARTTRAELESKLAVALQKENVPSLPPGTGMRPSSPNRSSIEHTSDQLVRELRSQLQSVNLEVVETRARLAVAQAVAGEREYELDQARAETAHVHVKWTQAQGQVAELLALNDKVQFQANCTEAAMSELRLLMQNAHLETVETRAGLGVAQALLGTRETQLEQAEARLTETSAQLHQAKAMCDEYARERRAWMLRRHSPARRVETASDIAAPPLNVGSTSLQRQDLHRVEWHAKALQAALKDTQRLIANVVVKCNPHSTQSHQLWESLEQSFANLKVQVEGLLGGIQATMYEQATSSSSRDLNVKTHPSQQLHSPHRLIKNADADAIMEPVSALMDEFDQQSPNPRPFPRSDKAGNGYLVKNEFASKGCFAADLQTSQCGPEQDRVQTSNQDGEVDPADISNESLVKDAVAMATVQVNNPGSAQNEPELGTMSTSNRISAVEPRARLRVRRQLPFSSLHMGGGIGNISDDSISAIHNNRDNWPGEHRNGHACTPGTTSDIELPLDTLSLISASEAARKPSQQLQESKEPNVHLRAASASSAPASLHAANIGPLAWSDVRESSSSHQDPFMHASYSGKSRGRSNLQNFGTRTSAAADSSRHQTPGPGVGRCDAPYPVFTGHSFYCENNRARDGEIRVEESICRFNERIREGQEQARTLSTRKTSSAGNDANVSMNALEPGHRHQKLRERLTRLKAELGVDSRPWESSPRSQLAAEVRRLEAELEMKLRSMDAL